MTRTDVPPTDSARQDQTPTRRPTGEPTILVVYYAKEHPLRQTIHHSLYAFQNNPRQRCMHLNLAVRRVPRWLRRLPVDLVLFHTTFLSVRWNPPCFERLLKKAEMLRSLGRARVAMPQDEYVYTSVVDRFIRDFNITHVYSTAPESQWSRIYPNVDRDRVVFRQTLTGYLDPDVVREIDRRSRTTADRPIHIGYRAKRVPFWLGEHGRLKVAIAECVREAAGRLGLDVDISTREEDTLYGEAWIEFLLACRCTIGVEGGASVLDSDGSIRARTQAYLERNPGASFEQAREACFAEEDGRFDLRAISPRHLEACAARTCQILIEGDYNGVLKPYEDYIPLKRDFSNLDEALRLSQDDDLRERITEGSWRRIAASGCYGYDRFVEALVDDCLPFEDAASSPPPSEARLAWARCADRLSWSAVRARRRTIRLLDAVGAKAAAKRLVMR